MTNSRGRKRLMYPHEAPGVAQVFYYTSPGVTFESDNMTDEEIVALSGEVITYKASELMLVES